MSKPFLTTFLLVAAVVLPLSALAPGGSGRHGSGLGERLPGVRRTR